MTGLNIRRAKRSDSAEVAEIYLRARKKFLPYAPLAHPDDEVRHWVAEALIPGTDVWIAVVAGRIAGMIALSYDGRNTWIDQFYLDPDEVGKGIGSELLLFAKKRSESPIRLYCFQENLAARQFYERRGFTAIEFGDGSANEENCPDVLYEWRVKREAGSDRTI